MPDDGSDAREDERLGGLDERRGRLELEAREEPRHLGARRGPQGALVEGGEASRPSGAGEALEDGVGERAERRGVEVERVGRLVRRREAEPVLEEGAVGAGGPPLEPARRERAAAETEPLGRPPEASLAIGEEVGRARGRAFERPSQPFGGGGEARREARVGREGAFERLAAVEGRPVESARAEREPAQPRDDARRGELPLAHAAAGDRRELVEQVGGEEAGAVGRRLPARGEEDDAAARRGASDLEEEPLLAGVARPRPRDERRSGLPGEGPPLLVEEEGVGAAGTGEELLAEARHEDHLEQEASRRDGGEDGDAVPLESTLPHRDRLEGVGEEREDLFRGDVLAPDDVVERRDRRERPLERVAEEACRKAGRGGGREPPGPLREGSRGAGGEGRDGDPEERLRLDARLAEPAGPGGEAPFRLLAGGPRALSRADPVEAPLQVVEAALEAELAEEPCESRGRSGGEARGPLERLGQSDGLVGGETADGEREETPEGAAVRRAGEASAGRTEEGDPAPSELGEERRLLSRRVAEEDRAGVERDVLVDRAEELAHRFSRLGALGRGHDGDGRERRRPGERRRRDPEEAFEERPPDGGRLGGRQLVPAVARNEGENRPLGRDGREEALPHAAEVVQAVDEERLLRRRAADGGGPRQQRGRVREAAASRLEVGGQRRDGPEQPGAVRCCRDGRQEGGEPVGRKTGVAQVVRGPGEEGRGGGALPERPELGAGLVLAEHASRKERLAERREGRARVGLRRSLPGEVEERQEAEVRDSAERLGGPPPEVDAEEVRADEDVDRPERVAGLPPPDLVEEARLERGEGAGEERVTGGGRHGAECTGRGRGRGLSPLSSGGNGRPRSRADRRPSA